MALSASAKACIALGALCIVLVGAAGVEAFRAELALAGLAREQTAHNATRAEYATAKNLWLVDQRGRNATVAGLAGQLNATLGIAARAQDAARQREQALFGAMPAPVAKFTKDEVVDHATSRKVVRRINAALGL